MKKGRLYNRQEIELISKSAIGKSVNDKNSKTNKMKKAEANGTVILTYAEAIALHDNK